MKQKNAWIYCRIDAPEDTHGVLKGQYEQLERYAGQMGFTVVGSSQDLGSGTSLDRPGLLAVREAMKAKTAEILLAASISRIGRDAIGVTEFIRTLSSGGVRVYTPMEGELTALPFSFPSLLNMN